MEERRGRVMEARPCGRGRGRGMAAVIVAPQGRPRGYVASEERRGGGGGGRGDRRTARMAEGVCRLGQEAGRGSGGPLPRPQDSHGD